MGYYGFFELESIDSIFANLSKKLKMNQNENIFIFRIFQEILTKVCQINYKPGSVF